MGVGPMNLVITNDALYQLSYTSAATRIIAKTMEECKLFFQENEVFQKQTVKKGIRSGVLHSEAVLCTARGGKRR